VTVLRNISNTCYEVMPFSLTHLLAIVGATVSWALRGGGGQVTHLSVGVSRKGCTDCVTEGREH
jgi:hypothetical protein